MGEAMKLTTVAGALFVCAAMLATAVQVRAEPHRGPSAMDHSASGAFEVTLTPIGAPDEVEGVALGRMSLDKRFRGGLEAVSKGEMLSVRSAQGSATYVAIERVSGALDGRHGGFVLVHRGVMTPEARTLEVEVAPGSGTGELKSLSGRMTIDIAEGKHSYRLDYAL
jgi:hypothetical protein